MMDENSRDDQPDSFVDEEATGGSSKELSYRPAKEETMRTRRWLIPGAIVAGIMVLCACLSGICLITASITAVQVTEECLALADTFMTAMAVGDTGEAYSLFSADAQRDVTTEQLQSMIDGPFLVLFEGYEELGMDGYYVNFDTAIGLNIELSGPVYYQDGTVGSFEATFQRFSGDWWLYYIEVNVPQQRIDDRLDEPAAEKFDRNRSR